LLLGLGMAEVWAALPSRQGSGNPAWTSLVVVVCTVPLVVRRSRPVLAIAVIAAGSFLLSAVAPVYLLFYGTFVPVALASFSVARHARGRGPLIGLGWIAVGVAGVTVFLPDQRTAGSVLFDVGGLGVCWLAGRALAVLERREAAARRTAVETEVAAATLAMAAVLDERTRIARELHDVVAHAVSVIVVQAGAAETVVEDDPALARESLAAIRTTGAGALAEMRRMVAMLRDPDDAELLAPQPGADGLSELVEHARRSGLDASLTVEGPTVALPTGLDLAVYRIVQEALSNVRRHAAASRVWVTLTYGADRLEVEVRDDGVGAAEGSAGPAGHGLIGMRERAALYGGDLDISSGAGDGFRVRALLPMAGP
jgi:signal transduction histidine kinase